VKPSPFTYHRPASTQEALEMLAGLGDQGKVLAGGQSLVPLMSMRLAAPPHIVDINHLPGLDAVEVRDDEVRIGALVRHAGLEKDEGAFAAIPLLRQALRNVAHPTIRNRGTTVGSIVHADPAAEMPAVLALLEGTVELASTAGTREVPAAAFFVGPMAADIRTDELAIGARFRRPARGSGSAFLELARRHGDYAMCGVAALVRTGAGGDVSSAKVALISVGPGPVLVDVTEAVTGGLAAEGAGLRSGVDRARLGELLDAQIEPEADIHATEDYRRHLAHVLTARALDQAYGRAAYDRGDRSAA
jgi:aerobic carbon-monoxide dehydrogenase medium subunit